MKYKIAVIISCYNEEKNIFKIYKKIIESIKNSDKILEYELIFIEDNSKDKTKENKKKIVKENKNVSIIEFKKRKGKSIGLQVAFDKIDSDTDLVFMMDADLQDDPKEIDRFIKKIEEGYDLVSGYKKNRLDNFEKRYASKLYNKMINLIFCMNLHDHNCGFKCFRKKVLKNLKIYDNLHRFITVFVKEYGYKVSEITVDHHKRLYGKSKYGFLRYFIGLKDIIRVKFIITHRKKRAFLFDLLFLILIIFLFYKNINTLIIFLCIFAFIYGLLIYNLNKYNKFKIEDYDIFYEFNNTK